MSQKELFVENMETQLSDWRAKLDAMKARLEEAELEGRLEFHKQIEASQRQHEVACRHLDELKHSGEEAWDALKAGIDVVWNELNANTDSK
jgi:hypothetical protein